MSKPPKIYVIESVDGGRRCFRSKQKAARELKASSNGSFMTTINVLGLHRGADGFHVGKVRITEK